MLVAIFGSALSSKPTPGAKTCTASNIPVSMLGDSGLKVTSNQMSLSAFGVFRWLGLRNDTGKTITRLIILVTYLDSTGRPVFAIPFYAGRKDSAEDMLMKHPFIKTVLNRPVKPGQDFGLEGTNLISTKTLPVRAEVTLVDEEFDDETSRLISAGTEFTNPILLRTPQYFELKADSDSLPAAMPLSVRVDDRGNVDAVDFQPQNSVSDAVLSQIRSQVMLWKFFPATLGGAAVKSDLNLLFRFHDAGIPFPAPTCPLEMNDTIPRTFVEVDLQVITGQKWQVQYGWQYAHGLFQTIESINSSMLRHDHNHSLWPDANPAAQSVLIRSGPSTPGKSRYRTCGFSAISLLR